MVFDNKVFEQGVATTLASLQKLNEGLKLQGATKGLEDVDSAAGKMNLGSLASGVDAVASKFSALGVIGITALTNITNKVIDAGVEMAKSFVFDPIKDGFANYETQINAVQTILANTAAAGTKIGDVNKVLAELNTYANQTVYNFSDMTKNIGTFTAAGVGLQTSVESIKGIANLAAMSGATSEQASSAMYQLSQAIASGTVKLQDWNSVVNAGLGGKTFQTALENTARAAGVNIDAIIKKAGSFRDSLQQGWLTSDILTKTLAQFTGDLSAAQLKAMGFTAQQAAQIQALGTTAVNAATKIKTMTQLTQALKEEVGTAYATIFKTVFGDIGQATDLFSNIHNVAENALTGPIYALNNLLVGWDKLGGRKELITDLGIAMKDLGDVIKVIEAAFREVFPPTTAEQLYNATLWFGNLVDRFKMGVSTSEELKRTLAGVFSIFSIAVFLVKQVFDVLGNLFGVVTNGSGGFLELTARVGDALVKFKDFVESGHGVTDFFRLLGNILALPIRLIQLITGYIGVLFDKFDSNKATKALDDVTQKLSPIEALGRMASAAWSWFFAHMGDLASFFEPLAKKAETTFDSLAHKLMDAFKNLNFQDVLNLINAGLFAGILLLVKKFVDKFKGGGELGDFVDTIKETFEGLTKTLETMQGTLKAATLLEIAAAVGILTIAVIALSRIDQAGLIRSSVAITAMFTQLVASMALFQKFIGTEGFIKMPFMAGSLILLATAIDILVIAVKELSGLDWNALARGLTGLGVLLAELVATLRLMGSPESLIATSLGLNAFAKAVDTLSKAVVGMSGLSWDQLTKGLSGIAGLLATLALFSRFAQADKVGVSAGLGIILLATGVKILASAMQGFANFNWTQIGKGLASMAGGLGIMAAALKLIPPQSVVSAAGVLIVASSLGKIASAMDKMGQMSWGQIAKGIVTMAGALSAIVAALALLPPESLLSAAAIFVVASSLGMVSDALAKMGGMSWDAIAKSLVELAGSLGIIALAVIFMEEALPGAAALFVVAASLEVLVQVLKALGNMSWAQLGEALAGLAGVFIVLGAAGLVLAPLTPILLALGAAIALMGAGMALAGAGVFLFAAGLTALSVAGSAGAAALVSIVSAMLGLLPSVAKAIGAAVVAFAEAIAAAAPAVAKSTVTILLAMLDAMNAIIPKLVTTLLSLLLMLLQKLVDYAPKLADAGGNLIIAILDGIARKVSGIVTAGANIIIAFLNGIKNNMPAVIQSAFDTIIGFINGLADAIRRNTAALRDAGMNLASAIIDGLTGGLFSGRTAVSDAAKEVAQIALAAAKKQLDSHSPSKEFMKIGADGSTGFALGLSSMSDVVANSSAGVGKTALLSMSKTIAGMSSLITDNIDTTPRITPVLDLSEIKKSAGQIGNMIGTSSVDVGSVYSKAQNASEGYSANQSAFSGETAGGQSPAGVSFTQNNYSPKALSAAELYRQTKNQLSQVRGVLVYQGGGANP